MLQRATDVGLMRTAGWMDGRGGWVEKHSGGSGSGRGRGCFDATKGQGS